MRNNRRPRVPVAFGLVSLAFVGLLTRPALADDPIATKTSAPIADVGAELPRLFYVKPGTRIDDRPPAGWSHLVLKSIPKVATGEIDTLPDSGRETATMFRTAIVVDVRPDDTGHSPTRYVLKRVGIAICTPHHGHDIVVTGASLESLDIALSPIPRIVLERTEKELAQGRLLARTPTFAVYRAPVEMVVDGSHRRVLLNYTFLADAKTGGLTTVVWWVDTDLDERRPPKQLDLLPANLVFQCNVDVSASRLLGTIPVSWSFAMTALPPGRIVPMPTPLQERALRLPQSHEEAFELERAFRSALLKPR